MCTRCGRCTVRTDTWETERVGQIHVQCPLSPIFKRYFQPTIDLLTWLSVVTALLANAIAAARGEAALKKAELVACAGRLVLRQSLKSCGLCSDWYNHAQLWWQMQYFFSSISSCFRFFRFFRICRLGRVLASNPTGTGLSSIASASWLASLDVNCKHRLNSVC